MARYIGPKHRLCRREGIPLCGHPRCPVLTRQTPPGAPGGARVMRARRRRRSSEYLVQLREKQKVRRLYGVLERQFRQYVKRASRSRQATGAMLLQLLERRLDNAVYRFGFAKTRPQARQLVTHWHVLVNDKRVTIPSYRVAVGEHIALSPDVTENPHVQSALSAQKDEDVPAWLERKGYVGRVKTLPDSDAAEQNIQEQLIVEYYAR